MRARRAVCQTLARISPLTNSSSLRFLTGTPFSRTVRRPISLNDAGSRKRRDRRSVAHDQPRAVVREAPAFARVIERLRLLERRLVVDEADLRLPGELHDRVVPDGDPLAEILRVERLMLHHLARLELDLADPRLAVLSGALVEDAVDVLQPLGEGLPVVWIDLDDAIAGDGAPSSAERLIGFAMTVITSPTVNRLVRGQMTVATAAGASWA